MIRYADMSDAMRVVVSWEGDPSSVVHMGNHGNSIFSFNNKFGEIQILRFTDPAFRSLSECIAELMFVNQLHADSVPVAAAIPHPNGALAFEVNCSPGQLICSSIEFAQGHEVSEDSPYWRDDFFREWGRNLALIHESSARLKPSLAAPVRWQWSDEILFRQADELIPRDDFKSREELEEILSECQNLGKSATEFGLIHADHAPQNFRYNAEANRITAFDFGNCCYHWYIADIAISLSTVRRKANRNAIKNSLLKGYLTVRALPKDYEKLIDLFIRLRVVYFYLSRLHMWSEHRTQTQEADIVLFRERVHSKVGWGSD